MWQGGRKLRQEPQRQEHCELDQHIGNDAEVNVPRRHFRRCDAAQIEQSRAERRVHIGGLQIHRQHDAEPDTIGTTTKMISKASITKPSTNTASITASTAPPVPPGRCVSRRSTSRSPPSPRNTRLKIVAPIRIR